MYKKSKRFLAGFLALLLTVTMLPTDMLSVAYAEEAEVIESTTENDDVDAVLDDADASDDNAVLDDADAADEVVENVKADNEAVEVVEDVKADNEADEALNKDNKKDDDALADSDADVDSDELKEEEVLDIEDADSADEDPENDLDNKEEIEDDELIYSQPATWTSAANDTLTRKTTWDFTGARTKGTDITSEKTLKGLKCLEGDKITFKNWSAATETKPSAKQGLSITEGSAAGIPLDDDTTSVMVKITLNSTNNNRVATISENGVRVWQKNSTSNNTGNTSKNVAAQATGDEYFDTTYTKTYTTSDMTENGNINYIKFKALLGEWKIDSIEITETKSKATAPKAAFTTDPALESSNEGDALHPGDELTVNYAVGLITEGLEEGQTDADASDIKWYRVKDGNSTEINTTAADKTKYTVTEDDIDSKIKVTVTPDTTYSDAGEAKSAESLTVTEAAALEEGFKTAPHFESDGNKEKPLVGDTLTVTYETGADETRTTPEIKWYRVNPENADDKEEITDAKDLTEYTLDAADENKKIKAVVSLIDDADGTKEALTGECETANAVSAWSFGFNESPALTVADDEDEDVLYPGETLTLSYELNNKEERTDKSEIKWYTVKDGNTTPIDGNDGEKTYTVKKADIGSTIKATVTPKVEKISGESDDPTGDPEDAETIVVSAKVVTFTTKPSLDISTGGNLQYPQPGNTLTVSYALDKAADDEDKSAIAWTRVDGTAETPLTADTVTDDTIGKSYTIVAADVGKTIKVSVTPKTDNAYASDGEAEIAVSNEVKEEGYTPSTAYNMALKGSDIPSGTYTGTFIKNEFTIHAGDDTDPDTKKSVAVDGNSKKINNEAYTARLKLSGQGDADYRSISFTTVKEATLAIACMSSNDSTPAKLAIAKAENGALTEYTGNYTLAFNNKEGTSVVTTVSEAYTAGGIVINNKLNNASDAGGSYITVTLPTAGTYYLYTSDAAASAVNFYEIKVTYTGGQNHGAADKATVTFNKNGGINDIDSQTVLKGEKCLAPGGPARDQYKFKGWYTDAAATTAYDFNTVVNADLTLYAGWETDSDYENLVLDMKDLPQGDYKKEFTYHGFKFAGSDTNTNAMSVASGSATVGGVEYTQVLKFGGTGNSAYRNISFTTTKKSTVTIVAIKGGDSGTRKLALNGSVATGSSANPTYSEEMTSTETAQKWVETDVPAGTWYVYSMNSGINIYYISVVEENSGSGDTYTVTFKDNDGSALTPAITPVTTTTGTLDLSEINAPTKTGKEFRGWTKTINGTTVDYFAEEEIAVEADTTLYAVWRDVVTYTITLKISDDPAQDVVLTVNENDFCNLTQYEPAKTSDGKVCIGWATSKDAEEPAYGSTKFFASGNMTLYPVMKDEKDIEYTVTFFDYNEDVITEATQKVKKGTEITLYTPAENSNYTFGGWYDPDDDEKTLAAGAKYTVNSDVEFWGIWNEKEVPKTGMDVRVGDEYYQGGAAIIPEYIAVYYKGEYLEYGRDYTVKGKNNVNAGKASAGKKAPTITIIGAGNYKGLKKDVTFNIKARHLEGIDDYPTEMTIIKDAKVNPVLVYNGKQLKLGKDFTLKEGSNIDAKGKYTGTTTAKAVYEGETLKTEAETRTMTVTGIGNYTGTMTIDIKVIDKGEAKQLAVEIDKTWKPAYGDEIFDNAWVNIFAGQEEVKAGETVVTPAVTPKVQVFSKTDKTKSSPLKYNVDYEIIIVSGNIYSAGAVKFTAVGKGEYAGSVSKSLKISPKKLNDGDIIAGVYDKWDSEKDMPVMEQKPAAAYSPAGAKLSNLRVYYKYTYKDSDGKEQTGYERLYSYYGDYKVTYGGNKKVGRAKATIAFLGDYKGTKAKTVEFDVTGENLSYVTAYAPDMTFVKAGKSYASKPIVEYDGTILKASEYAVTYEIAEITKDADGKETITWKPDTDNKVKLNDAAYVRAVIKPSAKSNFKLATQTQIGADNKEIEVEVPVYAEYHVRKAEGGIDLSKAKVTFWKDPACKTTPYKAIEFRNDYFYTPEGNVETEEDKNADNAVYVKVEVNKAVVDPKLYDVEWICGYNAGKATVIITGKGSSAAAPASKAIETFAEESSATSSSGDTAPTKSFAAGSKTVSIKINPIKAWIEPTKQAVEDVKNMLKKLF